MKDDIEERVLDIKRRIAAVKKKYGWDTPVAISTSDNVVATDVRANIMNKHRSAEMDDLRAKLTSKKPASIWQQAIAQADNDLDAAIRKRLESQ